MTALSITQPSELESLVTKAIYASLITARLSPASNPPTVNVTSVAPLRDVKPESLGKMIDILTAWETRCGDVIGDIEAEIVRIKTESARRRAEEREKEVLFEKALAGWGAKMDEKKVGGRGGGVIGGNKREFAADELDDDGYWEYGLEGGDGMGGGGSRMDIDDGAGARLGGASSGPARHPKRVLGKKS